MRVTRIVVAVFVVVVYHAAMFAMTAADQRESSAAVSPVGTYKCSGTQAQGKSYQIALAVEGQGSVYKLTWTDIQSGAVVMIGFGVKQGDQLAGMFFGNGVYGSVIYRVTAGHLDGVWTGATTERGRLLISDELFRETCRVGDPA